MKTKTLYIEGSANTDNGNLKEAFSRLFAKELKGKMPQFIMGDGKCTTIDKFYNTPIKPNEKRFLLIDSDMSNPDKTKICDNCNKNESNRKIDMTSQNTFLMIQEVEAWILSQPEVLTAAGIDMTKFNCTNVESISKPCEKLAEFYKKSGKTYTKVKEFAKIFPKLDTVKLKRIVLNLML